MVAEVEQLVKRPALLAHGIEPDVNLQPLSALLQRGEPRLAHDADGHDASRDGNVGAFGIQSFSGCLAHSDRISGMVCEARNWLG